MNQRDVVEVAKFIQRLQLAVWNLMDGGTYKQLKDLFILCFFEKWPWPSGLRANVKGKIPLDLTNDLPSGLVAYITLVAYIKFSVPSARTQMPKCPNASSKMHGSNDHRKPCQYTTFNLKKVI